MLPTGVFHLLVFIVIIYHKSHSGGIMVNSSENCEASDITLMMECMYVFTCHAWTCSDGSRVPTGLDSKVTTGFSKIGKGVFKLQMLSKYPMF